MHFEGQTELDEITWPGQRPGVRRHNNRCQPRLVIGLGRDAEAALRAFYPQARELRWPFIGLHAPQAKAAPSPDLLFAKHPSWVKRQHDDSLEQEYVTSLADALKWGFRDLAARNRPRNSPVSPREPLAAPPTRNSKITSSVCWRKRRR